MNDRLSVHVAEVAAAIQEAQSVVVLTGAGISAESGLPTFRDAMTGLWANYRPEDLATPEAFQRSPKLVWDWYAWRRKVARNAKPNDAHQALTALQRLTPSLTLITQNVDGLHQRAGSGDVIELHGNLFRAKCMFEGTVCSEWNDEDGSPPACPHCGGLLRPDVVWFGESLPRTALQNAVNAASQCDVFLSIGTSGSVEPAASLLRVAAQAGAFCAVINLEQITYAPSTVLQLIGPAGTMIPAIVNAAWPDADSAVRH